MKMKLLPEKTFIRFSCQSCNRKLKARSYEVGEEFECPRCDALVIVPAESTRPPAIPLGPGESEAPPFVTAAPHEGDGTVAVDMSIPKIGGMKTRVSQKTADIMAPTFLGGMLVVIGALLWAFLGVKPPRA